MGVRAVVEGINYGFVFFGSTIIMTLDICFNISFENQLITILNGINPWFINN